MRLFYRLPSQKLAPSALAIGNFDGVHCGHQALLAELVERARSGNLCPSVLTFEPRAQDFFAGRNGASALPRVQALRDKVMQFAALGIEQTIILPFDAALANTSAEDFMLRILHGRLNTRLLVVGDDFRFGQARRGDLTMLRACGLFTLCPIASVMQQTQRVSSTAVRQALQSGRLDYTRQMLGRRFSLTGRVIHGQKLGRRIGVPTINLRFAPSFRAISVPPAISGVFAAQVIGLADAPLPAAVSLGLRPSVESARAGACWLEAHLLDWQDPGERAYGRLVTVELWRKLRDEEKFATLQDLRAAIERDIAQTRVLFEC